MPRSARLAIAIAPPPPSRPKPAPPGVTPPATDATPRRRSSFTGARASPAVFTRTTRRSDSGAERTVYRTCESGADATRVRGAADATGPVAGTRDRYGIGSAADRERGAITGPGPAGRASAIAWVFWDSAQDV